jgi:hypothetical protein
VLKLLLLPGNSLWLARQPHCRLEKHGTPRGVQNDAARLENAVDVSKFPMVGT